MLIRFYFSHFLKLFWSRITIDPSLKSPAFHKESSQVVIFSGWHYLHQTTCHIETTGSDPISSWLTFINIQLTFHFNSCNVTAGGYAACFSCKGLTWPCFPWLFFSFQRWPAKGRRRVTYDKRSLPGWSLTPGGCSHLALYCWTRAAGGGQQGEFEFCKQIGLILCQ